MVCIISGVGRFPHFARICCLMTLYAKEHQVDGFIRWLVWHVWKKCLSISKKPEGVLSKKNTEKNAQLSKETFRNLAKKAVRKQLFFPEEIQDRVSMFLFASPFFCCEKCCVLKKNETSIFSENSPLRSRLPLFGSWRPTTFSHAQWHRADLDVVHRTNVGGNPTRFGNGVELESARNLIPVSTPGINKHGGCTLRISEFFQPGPWVFDDKNRILKGR